MQATLFKNNQNQAIRLPKSMEFAPDIKKVEITRVQGGLLITPADQSWDTWFAQSEPSEDFMNNRDQGAEQIRESFDD